MRDVFVTMKLVFGTFLICDGLMATNVLIAGAMELFGNARDSLKSDVANVGMITR